ncbi:MAG: choice-of-anchor U domain-containing protein [Thermodesulfobacteriota bacterium]|nr:choice-of-anchor U domain-containing protein [Thermodesulfobacteriota bacterium]
MILKKSAIFAVLLGMALSIGTVAKAAVTVTTSGAVNVSADTRVGGSAAGFTAVQAPDPVITEGAAADIGASIVITAPANFQFNTGQNVTATPGGGNDIDLGAGAGAAASVAPLASTITFSVTTASTVAGTITFTNIQVQPTNCTGATPGTVNVTITTDAGGAGDLNSTALAALTVNAGAINNFLVEALNSPQNAGTAINMRITARDACNNPIPNFDPTTDIGFNTAGASATVTYSNPSGGFTLTDNANGTATLVSAGVTTFSAGGQFTFDINNNVAETVGSFTADDGSASGNTGVTWNAGAINNFLVEALNSPQNAGTAINMRITARDALNNPIPNFDPTTDVGFNTAGASATVTYSNPSGGFTLTDNANGTATLVSAGVTTFSAGGQFTFDINNNVAETVGSFTADDGSASGNTGVTWNAGVVDHYAISSSSPQSSGTSITVTIEAQDTLNNPILTGLAVPNDMTVTVTGGTSTVIFYNGTFNVSNIASNTATIAAAGNAFDANGRGTFNVFHSVAETVNVNVDDGNLPAVNTNITWNAAPVDDHDNISSSEEMGPSGNDPLYDGNGDGRPDWQQSNVASFHTADGESYVTLAAPSGNFLYNIRAMEPGASPPENIVFPYGLLGFDVSCQSGNEVTLTLYTSSGIDTGSYYKYGPTPDNRLVHWYEFLYDGQTGAEIDGNTIMLHFVDGQRGDDDLSINGMISDEGGPVKIHTNLYFPNLTNSGMWQTRMKIINLEDHSANVTVNYYREDGFQVESSQNTLLPKNSLIIHPSDPTAITAMVSANGNIAGFSSFSRNGEVGDSLPAARETFTKLYIPHLSNDIYWWSGIAFFNPDDDESEVTITFNNGQNLVITIPSNGYYGFTLESLGTDYSDAECGVVTSNKGIVAMEMFGSQNFAEGDIVTLLLDGSIVFDYYIPNISGGNGHWTQVAVQNVLASDHDISLTGVDYQEDGSSTTHEMGTIPTGNRRCFDIANAFDINTGWGGLTAEYSWDTPFGSTQQGYMAGLVGYGDALGCGGYNQANTGFTRGIINLDSPVEGEYALLNPDGNMVRVAYTAYTATGEDIREGTFVMEAGTTLSGALSELLEQDLDSVSYILFEADAELHGYVKSHLDAFVSVLPIIRY